MPTKQSSFVNIMQTEGHDRFNDVFTLFKPNNIVSVQYQEAFIQYASQNKTKLNIHILTDDIVKFSYTHRHSFLEEANYAIVNNAPIPKNIIIDQTVSAHIVRTATLDIWVNKTDMTVRIFDKNAQLLNADTEGYAAIETMMRGTTEVKITKQVRPKEAFYGLGDKTCSLNLRGRKYENWCTDAFGFDEKSDHLYRAIPFFYGLVGNYAYGIFFDNTYKTHFDFDSKKQNVMSFSANGGDVHYYFIHGPQLIDVARKYADLTGKPELPPLWALGFHQCRWSYFPESRVYEVADIFRREQIPCDAIYLDIDYMDKFKCFTWDKEHFPNPAAMIAALKTKGFQMVVMIDPGITVDDEYSVYTEGVEKNYFLKRSDGELMIGQVWPGDVVYPDFTNPEVRKWFGALYGCLYEVGVSGFWNDMNEPANFKVFHKTIPDDVRHDFEGIGASHKRIHNVYGLTMTLATTEGLKCLNPQKRPFLLARATYSGGQRYAALWTGDNIASWAHLVLANRQVQRLSVSGFSFSGTDIGGFVEIPTDELMVRWLQLAVFHPFMRIHSAGNKESGDSIVDVAAIAAAEAENRLDQEPWSFGVHATALNKDIIEWRYRFLPVIYTAFWRNVTDGTPMILSMPFYDQTDIQLRNSENEFMFGKHLLVSPIVKKGRLNQRIYLPKGSWFDFYTGKQYLGNQEVRVKSPLSMSEGGLPILVAAGAVVPLYPVMQYTNEKPIETLTLKIYFALGKTESELYEDRGEGYDYQNGAYLHTQFTTVGDFHSFQITRHTEGVFEVSYDKIEIEVYGLPFEPNQVLVDAKSLRWTVNDGLTLPKPIKLSVNHFATILIK